ncbi:MAG: TatD family hydrolase [Pleomorphochaeta sp.]
MAKISKEKRQIILNNATLKNIEYVDSHAHLLVIEEKGEDINNILKVIDDNNYVILDIAINEYDIEKRYNKLKDYKNIYLSTALGPWGTKDTKEDNSKIIKTLQENINNYPIKAIGEIGLDNYWNYSTKELQEDLFIKQIELANNNNLPILIHNREADNQIINILNNIKLKRESTIHCFSSDLNFAKFALDKGFYISFASTITYKKNEELRKILQYVPLDRLLLETDSPYLSPEPFRGKTNTPLLIPLSYKKAAEIKKVTIEDLAINVKRNLLHLLDDSSNQ